MPKQPDPDTSARGVRLQKVLAAAGIGSRRDCEDLIRTGRVEVDRKVVTELGTRVDADQQEIRVDGESLRKQRPVYFAVNKPIGVVTTNSDPSGRPRVIDLVPGDHRVFAVGRLDRSSEGLILVTNDGEFANRLTHPRYGVEKTYLVRVAGAPDQRQLAKLKKGVHLAEGFARAHSIAVKKQHGQSTDLVIVLNEGRNREIRRILARVGHKVLTLKRVAVGSVKLGDLAVGAWRKLSPEEVKALLSAAKEKRREGKPRVQGSAKPSKVQGPRSKVEGGGGGAKADDRYVQKQALLAQPLSLDDLLRDDLDEGPLTPADMEVSGEQATAEVDGGESKGGVIDYGDDVSPLTKQTPPERRPKSAPANRGHGKQRRQGADAGKSTNRPDQRRRNRVRGEREGVPREDFGKKRGGQRVFGQPLEGRGTAGEKVGKTRFRPKHKKKAGLEMQGADNQRRGKRRGAKTAKPFKHGGKRKGRP